MYNVLFRNMYSLWLLKDGARWGTVGSRVFCYIGKKSPKGLLYTMVIVTMTCCIFDTGKDTQAMFSTHT